MSKSIPPKSIPMGGIATVAQATLKKRMKTKNDKEGAESENSPNPMTTTGIAAAAAQTALKRRRKGTYK